MDRRGVDAERPGWYTSARGPRAEGARATDPAGEDAGARAQLPELLRALAAALEPGADPATIGPALAAAKLERVEDLRLTSHVFVIEEAALDRLSSLG